MYRIGKEEVEAVARLFDSGQVFRYGKATECARFEERFAELIGVRYVRMTNSGTSSLIAALIGMGVGPGHDVIVPAYTYMASALAVLQSGAIPVVAEVDESLTLDPLDVERKVTRRTRAIMPVHMVGLSCDMVALAALASRSGLLICEDVCQAVGGGFEGRRLGSFSDAAGFSFNYFKNITAGEGGCFVTDREEVCKRGSVVVDCCSYYWDEDRPTELHGHFAAGNFRATEIAGAILNVQLGHLDEMLCAMRAQQKAITAAGRQAGLRSILRHSPDHDCGSHAGFLFDDARAAQDFVRRLGEAGVGSFRPIDTGRHIYTEWDPILKKQGAHHPSLNPYNLPENRDCGVQYTRDMCARSLDILGRAVLVGMHPYWPEGKLEAVTEAVRKAARG
jgi:dTDP-4-amino-4,6-dideoxygalactose transaminase